MVASAEPLPSESAEHASAGRSRSARRGAAGAGWATPTPAPQAAEKFGLSKQRYFQLLKLFREHGSPGLLGQKPGPKRNYVRTDEVVRQIIRHRFLDPDATLDILAQKLRQAGFPVSTRSVARVIEEYGLQKNSIATAPSLNPLWKPRSPRHAPSPCHATRGALSMEFDNFSPIRSWETWPACGCWLPSCYAWEPGDLVCDWTGKRPEVRAAAAGLAARPRGGSSCVTGLRLRRGLNQHIFEVANGLPFLATDMAIHELLADRTVLDSQRLQVALGKVRAPRAIFRDGFWPSILIAYAVSANATCAPSLRPSLTPDQDRTDLLCAGRRHSPAGLFHHRYLGTHSIQRRRRTTWFSR